MDLVAIMLRLAQRVDYIKIEEQKPSREIIPVVMIVKIYSNHLDDL